MRTARGQPRGRGQPGAEGRGDAPCSWGHKAMLPGAVTLTGVSPRPHKQLAFPAEDKASAGLGYSRPRSLRQSHTDPRCVDSCHQRLCRATPVTPMLMLLLVVHSS